MNSNPILKDLLIHLINNVSQLDNNFMLNLGMECNMVPLNHIPSFYLMQMEQLYSYYTYLYNQIYPIFH